MKKNSLIKFRSLFIAAAVIAAGSTPSLAPTPARADAKSEKRRGPSVDRQLEMMAQYLELTDKQKSKIRPILVQAQARSKKVRDDKSLKPEQKRAKMKTIREDSWKKISPILTSAQRKKIAEMRQNRGPRSGGKSRR